MKRSAIQILLLAALLLFSRGGQADDSLPKLPPAGGGVSAIPAADQQLTVTCYLGNPNDGQTLGDIMVTGAQNAGSACNSLNFSCSGRCFGCYSDFDFADDICVDSSGRRFLK